MPANDKKGVKPVDVEEQGDAVVEAAPVVAQATAPVVVAAAAAPRTVRIRGVVNRTSTIGGKVYTIEAEKNYEVPTDVAAILVNGRVAVKI